MGQPIIGGGGWCYRVVLLLIMVPRVGVGLDSVLVGMVQRQPIASAPAVLPCPPLEGDHTAGRSFQSEGRRFGGT